MYAGLEKSEEDYSSFTRGMPWLAVPYGDGRLKDLREYYKIRSIPQVVGKVLGKVVLRRNGNVLEFNGRKDIYELSE